MAEFQIIFPTEIFLQENLDRGEIDEYAGFHTPILLCFIFTWVGIFVVHYAGGPRLMGNLVLITGILPIGMLGMMLVYSISLDGAEKGRELYLKVVWCKLMDPELWRDALAQAIFSLSTTSGVLTTIGSYSKFDNDIFRNSIIIVLIDYFVSLIGGIVITMIVAGMVTHIEMRIENAMIDSSSLFFIYVAQAVREISGSTWGIWAALFFLAMFLLSFYTLFAITNAITQEFYDHSQIINKNKALFLIVFCSVSCAIGVPFASRSSAKLIEAFDRAITYYALSLCAFLECLVVGHFYGVFRFIDDIATMLGCPGTIGPDGRLRDLYPRIRRFGPWAWSLVPVRAYFVICWFFIAPFFLFVIHIAGSYTAILFLNNHDYSAMLIMIYTIFGLLTIPFLIGGTCVMKFYKKLSWVDLFRPTAKWKPLPGKRHRPILAASRSSNILSDPLNSEHTDSPSVTPQQAIAVAESVENREENRHETGQN